MKSKYPSVLSVGGATMLALAFASPVIPAARGQAVVAEKVTTTTTAGTVDEAGADEIVIRAKGGDPVRYTYTKTTQYVDETGAPVSVEVVKRGLPVTVYYAKDHDRLVAGKIIVHRTGTTATAAPEPVGELTRTTVRGTLAEVSPREIVVRSDASAPPIRYTYSKTTEYVDEDGQPVSVEVVKSGLPVEVHYIKEGDQLIAKRVIVRHAAPNPTVIEKKTTTTTTTTNERK